MNTPIYDFVKKYAEDDSLRLHMPGHKGMNLLGIENLDITEIDGADSLYEADGIIKESEENASSLFGAPTFYSVEGSSQCIKAMLYLVCQKEESNTLIWAGRNVHKSFLSAAVLLDFETEWIYPEGNESYLSCHISSEYLEEKLSQTENIPDAVYITCPDYLGNMCDVKALAEVCHRYGVLLLVDNAHGAYLKFLENSLFPTDLGADMCASSAHKTLPVLTGGAYLHISENLTHISKDDVKTTLSLFGSTSPSYLILQSLDIANKILSESYREKLSAFAKKTEFFKDELRNHGYTLVEDEILKITIDAKKYGYYGYELAEILKRSGIICEFSDPDFLVLMLTPDIELTVLRDVLLHIDKKSEIDAPPPAVCKAKKVFTPREAAFDKREIIPVSKSLGRILAVSTVGCPPAVPIIVGGEEISREVIEAFKYYNIESCAVTKNTPVVLGSGKKRKTSMYTRINYVRS